MAEKFSYQYNKFKRWKFLNATEFLLWKRLNEIWEMLEYEWRTEKYPHYFRDISAEAKLTDDILVFDFESFASFNRVEEEEYLNEDLDLIINEEPRAPVMYSITAEYFEVHLFLLLIGFYFFESIGFGLMAYAMYYNFIEEFFSEDEDAEEDLEPDEIIIDSLYTYDFELSSYLWQNYNRPTYEKQDFDFLFFYNVERHEKSSHYYDYMKKRSLLKYYK